MRAPAFWDGPDRTAMARILTPFSMIYGAAASQRLRGGGTRVEVPVICIGNVTVGGAGKTPTAIMVADLLAAQGLSSVFLTRGYGGRIAGPSWVVPAQHMAHDVGDEPLLLARHGPTVVSRDRVAGARLAINGGANIVIMDDGMQNPSLAKDLVLAVVDASYGFGNGQVLPAGPLRAPLAAQWPLIDAVVLLGDGDRGAQMSDMAHQHGKLVLKAKLKPDPATVRLIAGRKVLAFAGIGRPTKFFETARACGADIIEREAYPDHHRFSEWEIKGLLRRAQRDGLLPLTTEKDAVRIASLGLEDALKSIAVLPVRACFDDTDAGSDLLAFLQRRTHPR